MPPVPKSRVVLHTMCLCHGKHMAQGREEGGVAAVTEILYRVTLAKGRAQQGRCFPARYQRCPRYFEGRKHLNIAQGQAEELNSLLLLHSSVSEALCYMALKLHMTPWQLSLQVCPAWRIPPLKVMKATSQRETVLLQEIPHFSIRILET